MNLPLPGIEEPDTQAEQGEMLSRAIVDIDLSVRVSMNLL
jgi:hypothetical protein